MNQITHLPMPPAAAEFLRMIAAPISAPAPSPAANPFYDDAYAGIQLNDDEQADVANLTAEAVALLDRLLPFIRSLRTNKNAWEALDAVDDLAAKLEVAITDYGQTTRTIIGNAELRQFESGEETEEQHQRFEHRRASGV